MYSFSLPTYFYDNLELSIYERQANVTDLIASWTYNYYCYKQGALFYNYLTYMYTQKAKNWQIVQ